MLNPQSKILCIGEVLWDCLPTGNKPGGAPMNVALHLQKFGLDVSLLSKVGNDQQGAELVQFIQKSGLKTDLIQIDEKLPTSEVKVHLGNLNKVEYEICEPVAWDNIQYQDKVVECLNNVEIVVYGTLASRNVETSQTIQKILTKNCFKIIDVNLRPPHIKPEIVIPLIEKADLIKLNEDEIIKLTQWNSFNSPEENEQLGWISSKYNATIICLTKGDQGASLYINNQYFQHPGYSVNAIDTVGSGDAFLSGIIYSYMNGFSPQNMLGFACAAGALVATKPGATPDYNIKEIEAFL